jgi:excisionase family DNA binding protein
VGLARLEDAVSLSTLDAARELGIRRTTLWSWIEDGRIPVYRVGQKLLRIRREDLDAFIESCRVTPGSLGRR